MRLWHRRTEQAEAPAILQAAREDDAEDADAALSRLRAYARTWTGHHYADGPTRRIGTAR